MTNALACTAEPLIQQVSGETPEVMTRILDEDVNLAIWQRQLPVHIVDFGALLLSLDEPLADAIVIDMPNEKAHPNLTGLAARFNDLEGYAGFIADVSWLVSAYACLLGAKRIGLRLRALIKPCAPGFMWTMYLYVLLPLMQGLVASGCRKA